MTSVVVSESRGVRYLHLGSELVQGAMRVAQPDALEANGRLEVEDDQ